jgi:hypothetical protein
LAFSSHLFTRVRKCNRAFWPFFLCYVGVPRTVNNRLQRRNKLTYLNCMLISTYIHLNKNETCPNYIC